LRCNANVLGFVRLRTRKPRFPQNYPENSFAKEMSLVYRPPALHQDVESGRLTMISLLLAVAAACGLLGTSTTAQTSTTTTTTTQSGGTVQPQGTGGGSGDGVGFP